MDMDCAWTLAGRELQSRFFLGSAAYPSLESLIQSLDAGVPGMVTVSLRREMTVSEKTGGKGERGERQAFWEAIQASGVPVLPNTAGCRSAEEAVTVARMARELFGTEWIKLEVIGCQYTLQPDPFQVVEAARTLLAEGFEVLPYVTNDAVVAERLIDEGCRIIMPWAAPIGTGLGIVDRRAFAHLRARFPNTVIIVDAGIGKPSHACEAMELGADAVLVNTAVSAAGDPVAMAQAFRLAVAAGRSAWLAKPMAQREIATPTSPIVGTPFWQGLES